MWFWLCFVWNENVRGHDGEYSQDSDIVTVMFMSFPFSLSQSHHKVSITRSCPCPVPSGLMPVSTRSPVTTLSDKDDVTLRNPARVISPCHMSRVSRCSRGRRLVSDSLGAPGASRGPGPGVIFTQTRLSGGDAQTQSAPGSSRANIAHRCKL